MDLKLTVDGLEKERDFYFSKLRDIELICQEHESENSPVISGIIGILYATEVSSAFTRQCPRPPGPSPSGLALRREEAGPEGTLEDMTVRTASCSHSPRSQSALARKGGLEPLFPSYPPAWLTRLSLPPSRKALHPQRTTRLRNTNKKTRTSTEGGSSPG